MTSYVSMDRDVKNPSQQVKEEGQWADATGSVVRTSVGKLSAGACLNKACAVRCGAGAGAGRPKVRQAGKQAKGKAGVMGWKIMRRPNMAKERRDAMENFELHNGHVQERCTGRGHGKRPKPVRTSGGVGERPETVAAPSFAFPLWG